MIACLFVIKTIIALVPLIDFAGIVATIENAVVIFYGRLFGVPFVLFEQSGYIIGLLLIYSTFYETAYFIVQRCDADRHPLYHIPQ